VAGGLAPPIQSVVADLVRALPVPFEIPYPASATAVASTEPVTAVNSRPVDEGLIAVATSDEVRTDGRPDAPAESPDASGEGSTTPSEQPADDEGGSLDGCDLREVWGEKASLDNDEVESLRADVLQNCGFDILKPPAWARDHWGDDGDRRHDDGRFGDDSEDEDREGDRGRRERDDDDRSTELDDPDSTDAQPIEEPTDRGDEEQEESPDHNDPPENGETHGSPDDERRERRD